MSPEDFVYNSILDGAMAAGVARSTAKDWADIGREDFAKNKFITPTVLIADKIRLAKSVKGKGGKRK